MEPRLNFRILTTTILITTTCNAAISMIFPSTKKL